MARSVITRLAACFLLLTLASCWTSGRPAGTQPAASTKPSGRPAQAPQTTGGPKQLILIYSGETLSIPEANRDYNPPEGGLPALAHQILSYESMIMDFTRARIASEGGDPGKVKADYAAGMLGDSPFMLLDYGLWERPNDQFGADYVGLYLKMCRELHYTAVASMLYERLSAERWKQYLPVLPEGLNLLATAGMPAVPGLPTVSIVTRKVHGDLWGVVAAPQPKLLGLAPDIERRQALEQMRKFVELAAGELERKQCRFGILLMAGGPDELYRDLGRDKRFTVVIGATKGTASPLANNDMPSSGALLLPALQPGGRELGVCHLIYPQMGDRPIEYNLLVEKCFDHSREPYPFRKQAAEAAARHQARLDQAKAAAK